MRVDLYASENIRLTGRGFPRNVELHDLSDLEQHRNKPRAAVIIAPARELSEVHPRHIDRLKNNGVRVIVTEAMPGSPMPRFDKEFIHCTLPLLDERDEWRILSAFIRNAIELLTLQNKSKATQNDLEEITHIGVLLSSEKDTDKLLDLILTKTRQITNCDAGSFYLVDQVNGEQSLIFKMAQNDSITLNLKEFRMPLNYQSLAGYAILTGKPLVINNAYEIDPDKPYSHARWIDKLNNYRTITSLVVPLKNLKGEVLGGLQLINRKRDFRVRLTDPVTAMVMVQPFDQHSIDMVTSLASLAAVTLEKNMLYEAIQDLFEGFVKASVKAIESRDPTTSGHSERVAKLTVALAEAVNREDRGPLAKYRYNEEELREIRYASLLHDFGKVGVREHVLVKAKKLYPRQEELIRIRAIFIRAAIRMMDLKKRLDLAKKNGMDRLQFEQVQMEKDTLEKLMQLENDLQLVLDSNEPTVLAEGNFDRLTELVEHVYTHFEGEPLHLVTEDEVKILSIPRGSLTQEERLEIESHVTHTYNFLRQIPWTPELGHVADYAFKHHESLNGKGYPSGWTAKDLSMPARMMAICDIFDALTASDRPYKRAVSFEKALQILTWEMEAGKLDPDLLEAFKTHKVYNVVKEDRQ